MAIKINYLQRMSAAAQRMGALALDAVVRAAGLLLALLVGMAPGLARSAPAAPPLPRFLSETGLFAPGSKSVRPENLPFSPQYPLWSDGASKRRWLYLPPGTAIDASRVDAWEFPRGTRLWKEFSHDRRVETRFIERLADGSWRYATYVWNAEGTDAELAPAEGIEDLPVTGAPQGTYAVPGEADCRACHANAATPVLGIGALQLSPDRDPLAPHAEPASADHFDLRDLVGRGMLRNLPASLLENPPRIAASTPTERAALGYLHGNCAHCHNDVGPLASVGLVLRQEIAVEAGGPASVLRSSIGQPSRFRPPGSTDARRVVPGDSHSSVLAMRMRSRNPMTQMPPLGTRVADPPGLAVVQRWINELAKLESIAP